MEKFDYMIEEEALRMRMGGTQGEVTYINEDGSEIENPRDYFENKLKDITVTEKLNVGDVVKTKYIEGDCVVEVVDFVLNENVRSDYLVRGEDGRQYLISQDRIVEVCSRSR